MEGKEKQFKNPEFSMLNGLMENLHKKMDEVSGLFPKGEVKTVEINGVTCNAHIGAAGCIVLTFPNGTEADMKQLFDSLKQK